KELGIKAKFLGGDGVCTPEFMKLGGEATEGQYCSLPGMPLEKLAKGPGFKDKFAKKFGVDIQLYAPYVYDAVMVMADSMKRANSVEPAKYLPEVGKTHYDGVTSLVEFDQFGDLKGGAISVYQYKGGKLEYVETLGGAGPVETAKAEIKEAVAEVKDAAKAVAGAASTAGAEAVKAGSEAVKSAAEATRTAVEKK
ncbi:MAG TPA: ABC transporter substrate-binding protein, partial [Azonexus sp.]|nr:ABC transporter substrate-binding protein [Azonexus sp.]